MFTGIVTALGVIAAIEICGPSMKLTITVKNFLEGVNLGDSISVNGCCLTVTQIAPDHFCALLSAETLMMTTFHDCRVGTSVNLEKSLTVGQPLGGHWVTGHVDGQALLMNSEEKGQCRALTFQMPIGFEAFVAPKGSVAIDGMSLTINWVQGRLFGVMLIEHTLECTVAKHYQVGTKTNFEVDVLARYVNQYHRVKAQEVIDVLN